jgi:hypothetical protein
MGAGNTKKIMIPNDVSFETDQSMSKIKKNGYFTVNERGFQGEIITFKDDKLSERSRIIVNEEEKKEDIIGTF